jgi:MoaA/NifB/PqqE/SkfB family radical SAM enzyme
VSFGKFIKNLNRPALVNLTGGEVTTHPQITELMTVIRENGAKVKIDTNGVRTPRWYAEYGHLADVWCMCFHPSQHKFNIERVRALTDKALTLIYLMMDPKHWDLAMEWYTELKQVKNIKLIVLRPVDNWAGANYQYIWQPQQLEFLKTEPSWQFTDQRRAELELSHAWMLDTDTIAFWDDGSQSVLDPDMLMKTGINSFTGWECHAGKESLMIHPEGTVYWGNCARESLGHYSTFDIESINKTYKCTFDWCTCGSDIRASKELN